MHTPRLTRRNAAVIKATASSMNLAEAAQGVEEGAEGPSSSSGLAAHLIPKKAGLRTSGVLFLSSAKTWWAGLALILVAALVFAVTLLTAGGGAGH